MINYKGIGERPHLAIVIISKLESRLGIPLLI